MRQRLGDAHVQHLPHQPGPLRPAVKVDDAVAFGAAHQFLRVLFAWARHQNALGGAHAAGADALHVGFHGGLQVLQALQFHLVRGVVGQVGRGRAGPGAEDEAERAVKAHVGDELHQLLKIRLGLAGEADDEITA